MRTGGGNPSSGYAGDVLRIYRTTKKKVKCLLCKGTGGLPMVSKCPICNGKGTKWHTVEVEVEIQPTMERYGQ